ncbi:MAG: hypothetical protein Q8L76_16130, partial [Cypionkella sp.]|nr:hypothetical protein [Cypionkella sp.]
ILCVLLVSSVVDPRLHKKLIFSNASVDEIRGFLGASKAKTTERIQDDYNTLYDHNLTFWLVTILYTCGSDSVAENKDFPSWRSEIGKQFEEYGSPGEPKRIPSQIQKDWVDVFRI